MLLKFKTEIFLLLLAIALYIASAFFYSYEATWEGNIPVLNNPYRDYAIPLAGVASALLVIAAVLYSKRK
jgi:phenolic acid decarboxylase